MRENLKFNPPTDLSTINADHLILKIVGGLKMFLKSRKADN
jgi:hypothetical protein